jgi:hypothetical protein
MSRDRTRIWPSALLVTALAAGIWSVGCQRKESAPPPPQAGAPTAAPEAPKPVVPETHKPAAVQVRRDLANVLAGAQNADLKKLDDDQWHPAGEGWRLATDPDGEGVVDQQGCMLIHLFQKGELMAAPCSKAMLAGGNTFCQQAGTAVYNNKCSSQVKVNIQTRTAEISLLGTWLSVTYLPGEELTVAMVFEGSASIRPVINVETRELGEPVIVQAGQGWYSLPDNKKGLVADAAGGVAVRQPADIGAFKPMITGIAALRPWVERIQRRAEADKVALHGLPSTAPVSAGTGRPH